MKYNSYFETQHYRECALCRHHSAEKSVGDQLHKAIVISFLVGIVDIIIVALLGKYIDNLWIRLLIDVVLGGFCGLQLGLMWRRMYRRICARLKHLFYDIQVLTDKIDALQEDNAEDYELVGDTDDETENC